MSPSMLQGNTFLYRRGPGHCLLPQTEKGLRPKNELRISRCRLALLLKHADRQQIASCLLNGQGEGGSNGSGQAPEYSTTNGFDAARVQAIAAGGSKSNATDWDDGSVGSSNGGGDGGGGGGNGGEGNGDRQDDDSSRSHSGILFSLAAKTLQPRTLVVVVFILIYRWVRSRRILAESPQPVIAAGSISHSHELAKQLFDDALDAEWADVPSVQGGGAPVKSSSLTGSQQGSLGPLESISHWISSPLLAGGELKKTSAQLRQDICALKRLQRDTFEQLLRMNERLEEMEQDSEASGSAGTDVATLLRGSSQRSRARAGASNRPQVHVAGQLMYSREFFSLEAGKGGESTLEDQGPDMRLSLSAVAPDRESSLLAQLQLSSVSNDVEWQKPVLMKVLYRWVASNRLKFLAAVVKGRGDDVAPTLNPQAGRGVTPLMRHGCTIHQKATGEGLGVSYKGDGFTISAGHLHQPEDVFTEQSSTSMVQLDCAPSQQLALGLVAARQTSPPAPPPRRGKTTRFRSSAPQPQEAGTSSREGVHPRVANSMGITGAWRSRYDEYAVGGWLALNRMRNSLDRCWGLTLSSIPTPEGDGWALCIGRGTASCRGGSFPARAGPLMLEASLQVNAGGGLLLSPSLVCTRAHDSLRAGVAVRSELNF